MTLSTDQPYRPEPPDEPHFDAASNTWTLSRYVDVYGALREPALQQTSMQSGTTDFQDRVEHERLFAAVQADMMKMSAESWRARMTEVMCALMDGLRGRRFDLVSEVIHPWSIEMMLTLSEPDQTERENAGSDLQEIVLQMRR